MADGAIEVIIRRWTVRQLRRAARVTLIEGPVAHLRALRKRREWRPMTIRPGLAAASVVLVTVVKDELLRLEYHLDYYRRLGVQHFVIVDNGSSDGVLDHLQRHQDVSTFVADGDYGEARYAVDWVNGILSRYCPGKWVMWVDADEVLVFSDRVDATIPDLTRALTREGRRSVQAIMIDMYSDQPPSKNRLARSQDPLEVCRLFDGRGYRQTYSRDNHTSWIKGGVRARLFFSDTAAAAPALNKTPLVRWRRHYVFLKSTHQLWPSRLNGTTRLGASLLHFKFTEVAAAKIADTTLRAQHTTEYDAYTAVDELEMVGPDTATYASPEQLSRLGLMQPFV